MLAHGCANAGLVAEARSNADEAGARLDELPDDALALYLDAVSRLAWAEYLIERFDDSIRHAARGVAVARATGQGQFVPLILSAQALSTTIRGDLSAATALQEEAIEAAEVAANDYVTSAVLTATAHDRDVNRRPRRAPGARPSRASPASPASRAGILPRWPARASRSRCASSATRPPTPRSSWRPPAGGSCR